MIRKAIIVMLTLATIGTGALGVLSFRKDHVGFDPGTQQSWQVYGWHSGGVEVGDRLMLFFDAEVGTLVRHNLIGGGGQGNAHAVADLGKLLLRYIEDSAFMEGVE